MKALIVGGGIAGCAVALALHREGVDAAVYERRSEQAHGTGAFLTLAANGVRALDGLGVDVAAMGAPTPSMRISLGDGRPLTTFPMGDATRSIRRADLYGALRAEVEARGIEMRYGARFVDRESARGQVHAVFEDGTTATADLLVGADGIGSKVRATLSARAPRARYLGLLNAGGFAAQSEVGEVGRMEMFFGRRTFFSYLQTEDDGVWWFANPTVRREPESGALARTDAEHWRSTIADLVRDDIPLLGRIVGTSYEIFDPWPMHDFPRVPVWRDERTIIIGDAAHAASPSSGQGAAMAIEDAAALGLLLGRSIRGGGSISTALETYETVRRPRVERVIAQGKRSSGGKAPGVVGSRIRDAFMRRYFAKPRPATNQSWLWDYRVEDAVSAAS
jgi:2-polyprenyl-6-methoxyphenol hydroxylase-like FAD-dependent oxidoreductase